MQSVLHFRAKYNPQCCRAPGRGSSCARYREADKHRMLKSSETGDCTHPARISVRSLHPEELFFLDRAHGRFERPIPIASMERCAPTAPWMPPEQLGSEERDKRQSARK